jgi:hypothetical protein
MERHQIDEQQAFALLRDHARRSGRKLVDVAQAILDGFLLLPAQTHDRPVDDVRQVARGRTLDGRAARIEPDIGQPPSSAS